MGFGIANCSQQKSSLPTRFAYSQKKFAGLLILSIFARSKEARMAESVDALVSNTSRFTPVPVRPRLRVQEKPF